MLAGLSTLGSFDTTLKEPKLLVKGAISNGDLDADIDNGIKALVLECEEILGEVSLPALRPKSSKPVS